MRSFQDKTNRLAAFLSLIIILISLNLTFYLKKLPTNEDSTSNESMVQDSFNKPENQLEQSLNTQEQSFAVMLDQLSNNEITLQETHEAVTDIIQTDYHGNILSAKNDILEVLKTKQMGIEDMGTLFLPDRPSFASQKSYLQLDVPLILQKSPRYASIDYGVTKDDSLADNGCAIVSLAMIYSYITNRMVEPTEILDWSGKDYFVENEGTSWTIFSDFALDHGFNFYNHGNNFYSAMEAVQNDQVVIASVEPGYFTNVGHIIVIRGYEPGYVYVNDPNDNPEKMYSFQPIDEQVLLDEGLNYWSFYRN